MKKILLGTTAVIALGTLSTEAFAAEKIKLELGGFARQYVGVTDSDEVTSTTSGAARDKDISQFSNTEIYFTGSTVLDNGIKVAARIEMEADGGATDNVDRNYLAISSDGMGTLTMGQTSPFGEDNMVRAPMAGNFDWTDLNPWVGVADSATASTGAFAFQSNDISDMGDDTIKVKYASPSFSGFSVGGSYGWGEGASETHNARRVTGDLDGGYTVGIAYSGEVSGVAVSADITRAGLNNSNFEQTHVGLNVGMSGFTIGGGWTDYDDTQAAGTTGLDSTEGSGWELGIGYETGPYSLSAAYMNVDDKGTATAGDDEDTAWQVVATYDLGAGVALSATYFNIEADGEGSGTTTATGRKSEASGLIAGIEVGF
jgi:outer membrane protein OmpU